MYSNAYFPLFLIVLLSQKIFLKLPTSFNPKIWGSKNQKSEFWSKIDFFLKFRLGLKILRRQQRLRPRKFLWCFFTYFWFRKKFWSCQLLLMPNFWGSKNEKKTILVKKILICSFFDRPKSGIKRSWQLQNFFLNQK